MTSVFAISFKSELERMREALCIVLTKIKDRKPRIADEDFKDLRLIFTELLSNAIIHGNKYDSCKNVHIIIELTEKGVSSKISDEGNGFNYVDVLRPRDSVEDLLLETGRGIKLASSVADELTFNAKGNEVKFSKSIVLDVSGVTEFTYSDSL